MRTPTRRITALTAVAALSLAAPAGAQAPSLTLDGLFERGGQVAADVLGDVQETVEGARDVVEGAGIDAQAAGDGRAFGEGVREGAREGGDEQGLENELIQLWEDGRDAASRSLQGDDDELTQALEDIEQALSEAFGGEQAAETSAADVDAGGA